MADVLFVTPNIYGDILEEPVGTLTLATILAGKGMNVQILPFFRFGDPEADYPGFLDQAVDRICREDPRILSFYSRCDTYHISLTIAQRVKERKKDIYIVFGGPQSDLCAEATVAELDYVDFVCCGEGETVVYPLFSSLLRGEPDLTVAGLVYRDGDAVRKNPRPQLLEDLDSLPEIDYSFFHFSDKSRNALTGLFPIDVGRGCPFGCTYCSTKTFWGRKYRLKSPRRIVSEVKAIHERFGVTGFAFEHDMFTMRRTQVVETCALLKALDFPVVWRCSARLDCIDRELIDIMADAGMRGIFVGIETGSERMQKKINKNLKLDGILDMLGYIQSKGIEITVSFIYGFPEETEEDVAQTMAMIADVSRIPDTQVQTHLCTFLPGTELSQRFLPEMVPTQTYSDITGTIGMAESRALIDAHPALFLHLREYKTELRTRLRHFSTFFRIWQYIRPVFNYIAEKYPRERLLDMYYDYARANAQVLEEAGEEIVKVLRGDRFIKTFAADENYDLMLDIWRLKVAQNSEKVLQGGTLTGIYCFSPNELVRCERLQDYQRSLAVVTCIGDGEGNVRIHIQNRGK